MQPGSGEQTELIVGVDVGGTFTDLVAFDGRALKVVKVPSSPPAFEKTVVEAVGRALAGDSGAIKLVHGSTVATNALLQRAGEPVAFVTTEGFADMLLIGRQNRPRLYALRVERPEPLAVGDNCLTVRERVDAQGKVICGLDDAEIDRVVRALKERGLKHVAVCLLFSFINPIHEERLGNRLAEAGLTVSLSSEILPEFREYERASTTAINASLRPTVQQYLERLSRELPDAVKELRITQSGGGTLEVSEAARSAAKLVLSGPAGGVMGAAFVAQAAGAGETITYDMGGTSTDVATVINGRPNWTTNTTIDGLPLGLPMYDIHTVGAGGGSIAHLDAGGALRVGPRSAGAVPGPACYGRGGKEPTVTDANLLLGRILPDQFLGGTMRIELDLARQGIEPLARAMGKSITETALGIIRIAEANMANAIRAVTARRGHDPRRFALVSFGGAGGLHACALAEGLKVPRVIVPPYCGVLSALGMVVAPPLVDVSRTVVHRSDRLSDAELEREYAALSEQAQAHLPEHLTASVEYFADVRFRGQSHELKVAVAGCTIPDISRQFYAAYRQLYGRPPRGRAIEIVTLRVRRIGRSPNVELPAIVLEAATQGPVRKTEIIDSVGATVRAGVLERGQLIQRGRTPGPLILVDAEATTFVPAGWLAKADDRGIVELTRM